MKTKKLLASLALISVVLVSGCKKDQYLAKVGVCPLVVSTIPASGAVGVPLNQVVSATFNEQMNPATITSASFTLTSGIAVGMKAAMAIDGVVTYSGVTATFTPSLPLTPNTTFTGRMKSLVKDLMGNALQTDYVWTFTTGIQPTVVSVDPVASAINVVLNKVVTATFSVPMDPLTINTTTFNLKQGVTPIAGTVTYTGTTATLTTTGALTPNTVYTGTITAGAKNAGGIAMADDYVWTFNTGISPTVISTDPLNSVIGVSLNKIVAATFSVPMDPLTFNTTTFTLKQGSTAIAGAVTYTGSTASFTPTIALTPNTVYTGTITTGAKNVVGIPLANNYAWTFTTGISPTVTLTSPLNLETGVVQNKVITATFSVPMDPLTITGTTFTLKQGSTAIAGAVTYSGSTASFTPTIALTPNTVYTGTITASAKNVVGIPLANDYVWTFTTGIAPTVTLTSPLNLETGVVLNKVVTATFSVPMDPLTITGTTFTLKQGSTAIAGAVTYTGSTASFTPTIALTPNTVYTGTITAGAKNVGGIAMANDYTWTFTTGIAPTVTLTSPLNLETGVVLNKVVTATFSVPMDPLTIAGTTFTLKQGINSVAGAVTYTGSTASFTPTLVLSPNTVYTGTITTGAKNVGGIPLAANYTWTFTTGIAPTVTLTSPLNLETGIVLNKVVTATFSVPMDPLTITGATFTLKQGTNSVAGAVTYTGSTASFTPTLALSPNTVYTGTITTGAKNVGGISLAADYSWIFTTIAGGGFVLNVTAVNGTVVKSPNLATYSSGAIVQITATPGTGYTFTSWSVDATGSTNPLNVTMNSDKNITANFTAVPPFSPVVNLNSAGRFGILSGVGISNNAGFSVINNMDVGISPGARSSVTGFPPATVVGGAIYASDDLAPPGTPAMLTQAKLDLTNAYLFAEGATAPAPVTVSGDQGGKTLAPGIYKSTSTLLIQAGDLTLDGQGDPNATWIFQVASAFTTVGGAGGNVILTGGAQAKNIFWQTGSSAVIGDYTSFYGNVLALQSITMNSHATAVGRMLARNGAVVMTATNIINKP